MIEKQENYNTQEELEMDTMENMEVVEAKVEFKVEQEPEGAEEISEFEFHCKQYKEVNKKIEETRANYDSETESLRLEINRLQIKLSDIHKEKYQEILTVLSQEKDSVNKSVLDNWKSEKKTVETAYGKFTRKVLKSIEINDKNVLIAELSQKGLLNKVIKTFDNTKLRSWIEDEVIEKGALLVEKHSLAYKKVE